MAPWRRRRGRRAPGTSGSAADGASWMRPLGSGYESCVHEPKQEGQYDAGARRTPLRGVPAARRHPQPADPAALVDAAVGVVEQLCGRALAGGGSTAPAPHGDVALELRDLVPTLDDSVFDRLFGAIARAAWLVTVGETADSDEVAFAEAAWAAGLDRADFALSDYGDAEFRAAVVEHWDLELRIPVERLIASELGCDPALGSVAGRYRTA
jgi:hypothetical protein